MRTSTDGNTVYLAIMRGWAGTYRNNIEVQSDLEKKFGQAEGQVTVRGLANGSWQVEKIHRKVRNLGTMEAQGKTLSFPLDPAYAGEVQMYRLRRIPPQQGFTKTANPN